MAIMGCQRLLFVAFFFLFAAKSLATTSEEVDVNSIKKVHIVFMNHLDVGYSLPGQRGFIPSIVSAYFNKYFPQAITTAALLKLYGYQERFIYTTHPWLVSLFLNCPPNLEFHGVPVKCPSATTVNNFKAAVKGGDITWHAGPMNMQMENGNGVLTMLGLNISAHIDDMLGIKRRVRVLSQRDVPGTTQTLLPYLQNANITAISIGVNPGSSPPSVNSPFLWKYGNASIITLVHKGGYPNNAGQFPIKPGGLSAKDCHMFPGFTEALCFAFRTDNTGPPTTVQQVLGYYEDLRVQFPKAKLVASTFDNYVEALLPFKSKLPIVTQEIGDNWIQGISSDPKKIQVFRGIARSMEKCFKSGACKMDDPRIVNASRFLIKPTEHTWGINSVYDTAHWTNDDLDMISNGANGIVAKETWLEQRSFNYLAIEALGDHPVVETIEQEIQAMSPVLPDISKYKTVDISQLSGLTCKSGAKLGIDTDGSIRRLYDPLTKSEWASLKNPLAKFVYRTYNQTDFGNLRKTYEYTPGWDPGYGKPNSTASAHPVSKDWTLSVAKAYMNPADQCDVMMQLEMNELWSIFFYGAPDRIMVQIKESAEGGFDIDYYVMEKTPTRLAESLSLVFQPVPQPKHRWYISKLGYPVDPENVMLNGSQQQHASDNGVYYLDSMSSGIHVSSADIALVCPYSTEKPLTVLPTPLTPIKNVTGMGFNLYNNAWNTNYIYWYPYLEDDKSFKARFQVRFLKGQKKQSSLKYHDRRYSVSGVGKYKKFEKL